MQIRFLILSVFFLCFYKTGDDTKELFILRQGEMALMLGAQRVAKRIYPRDCVGEMSFKYGADHTMGVVATKKSTVYVLSRFQYDHIVNDPIKYFESFPLLQMIKSDNMSYFYARTTIMKFAKDQLVCEAGKWPTHFYIVLQGTFR